MAEKVLSIAAGVSLPLDIVTQKNAVLAMSGAGKSNACVVLAEEMHRCGVPWLAIDPKGDWWGVRASRDGKGRGLDVPVLGGEHGDLPLSPTSGARMAQLVAEGKLYGVLDVSEFDTKADLSRFLTDFAETLLKRQRTPIHLFLDECDEYLPQAGSSGRLDGPAAHCVGAWKKLAKRGRFRGIGYTMISQRAAAVNKDALYQCETLIAMRVMGERDKAAIQGWVEQLSEAKELIRSLPTLEDGEAWIWSPQRLKLTKRVRFRRRSTFDSGRTPEIGEALSVPKLADIDLSALRKELAKEAQADDSDSLRRRIAELEGELSRRTPMFEESHVQAIHALNQQLAGVSQTVGELLGRVTGSQPAPVTPPAPERVRVRPILPPEHRAKSSGSRDSSLPTGERAVLTAIAQHHDGVTREQLSILTGYKKSSRDTYLQKLRAGGHTYESAGRIHATPAGRKALGSDWKPLPTGAALRTHWLERLPAGERAILEVLVEAHPKWVSRDELSKVTGYRKSSRDTYIQKLRARRLASDAERGGVKAADELFE